MKALQFACLPPYTTQRNIYICSTLLHVLSGRGGGRALHMVTTNVANCSKSFTMEHDSIVSPKLFDVSVKQMRMFVIILTTLRWSDSSFFYIRYLNKHFFSA